MILKPLKILYYILLTVLIIIMSYITYNYITCPIYNFDPPNPFSGTKIYNPYEGFKEVKPLKANFHAHTQEYMGLTFGENSETELKDLYSKYGYDIYSISNYQKISQYLSDDNLFIPAYEHGYNIFKFHQLNIGAKNVSWRDYPLFMTLSNKQDLLKRLDSKTELLALCHPAFTLCLSDEDLQKLSGYDLMEVVSGMGYSVPQWDIALSAGRLSFAVGNDDSHDLNNIYNYAKACTYIYADNNSPESVYKALKSGNAFAALLPVIADSAVKIDFNLHDMPLIENIGFNDDTITVKVSEWASNIDFIGQDGKILFRAENVKSAEYIFDNRDTYVRIEINFHTGVRYYLNPFFRYSDNIDIYRNYNKIDYIHSVIYWIICFCVLSLLLLFIFKQIKRKLRRNKIRKRWYNED